MTKFNFKNRLSLKSAICRAMLVSGSIICTSDVWAAFNSEIQQEGKWNISIYEILKDCGFSNEFISKLSDEDSVRISTNMDDYTYINDESRPFTGNTTIEVKLKNSAKFPINDIQKMRNIYNDNVVFERTIHSIPPFYATQLFTIAQKCIEEARILYMYEATMEQKNKFANLIKEKIPCLKVLVNETTHTVRLKFENLWFIDFKIINNHNMTIDLTKDSKDMYY